MVLSEKMARPVLQKFGSDNFKGEASSHLPTSSKLEFLLYEGSKMAEKNFNARQTQKTDTEENWKKAAGFVPKKGELIIY
jgi:hypothetical protein